MGLLRCGMSLCLALYAFLSVLCRFVICWEDLVKNGLVMPPDLSDEFLLDQRVHKFVNTLSR